MKHYKVIMWLVSSLLPFCFLSWFSFLKIPVIWPDEALFVDTSLTFLRTGHLATHLLGSQVPGMDTAALWNPPVYFYLLSLWINFFGFSIESVRALSVSVGFLTLIVFFFFLLCVFHSRKISALGVILVSFDLGFLRIAHLARMDILTLFFILLSLLCVVLSYQKSNRILFLLAVIVASLATTVHPMGVLAPLLSITWIMLFEKKIKRRIFQSLVFIIGVGIANAVWLASLLPNISLLVTQYHLQFLRKETLTSYFSLVFFTDVTWWAFFIISFILAGGVFYVAVKTRSKEVFFVFISYCIVFAAFVGGKEMWYLGYLSPFAVLMVLVVVQNRRIFFPGVLTLGALYVFLQIKLLLSVGLFHSFSYHVFTKNIAKYLPEKSAVFLSVVPDPYFDLSGKGLTLYEFSPVPVSSQAEKKVLNSVDFVVINQFSSSTIKKYLEHNALSVKYITTGGYSAAVIKLKDKRITDNK